MPHFTIGPYFLKGAAPVLWYNDCVMSLLFRAIASGSSGNSYFVHSGATTLLVDVGISGKRIAEGLAEADLDIKAVDGILITHEHSDHIKSLGVIQRKAPRALVYSNAGTFACIADQIEEGRHALFTTGEDFTIGDITVHPFPVSHDAAEPVGYTFTQAGSEPNKVAIVMDTGHITDEIYEAVCDADIIALEANHDENVLMVGRYPYYVKRRILSDMGHLCNEAAAAFMCRILTEQEKRPVFLLAHLSRENNTPDMALITVRNALEEAAVFDGRSDSLEDLVLEVALRDRPSRIFRLK